MTALSTRWAGSSHRALSASTSTIQRLALALGPVKSLVRVVDNHVPPMAVDWAQVGKDERGRPLSLSYTDMANGRIALNPLPVLALSGVSAIIGGGIGTNDPGRAIDVVSGFALHEASHGMHSRDRYKDLITTTQDEKYRNDGALVQAKVERPVFRPMRVAAYLWNLVEDVRIEGCTSADWPGFAPYFDAVLDWVWADMRERHDLPTFYGTTVAGKMKVVFLACRYPHVELPGVDPAEIEWWKAWQADYLADRTDVRETVRRGLDHLGEDEATKAEMEQMGADEKREEAAGERIRAQLDRLMREGITGTFEVCIGHEGEMRPLTAQEAEGVDKLIREGLMVIEPVIVGEGANCAEIRVSKPEETPESRRVYIGKPDATVEALRAALVFRQALPRYDIKLQKSGELDDTELHRWSMGDNRLFTERVVEGRPDTLIGLLVDLSGSMAFGNKLPTAQRLAQLLLWALNGMDGIETRVWGHTADISADGADIYRLWEDGDPLTRLGLIGTLPHGNNADGHAIGYCVSQMVDAPQPQKILLVLADGLPSTHTYGGEPAARHVRQVTDWARRQGVQVLQIAIDPSLNLADQVAMFSAEGVIPYKTDAALPKQLTQVLSRWT